MAMGFTSMKFRNACEIYKKSHVLFEGLPLRSFRSLAMSSDHIIMLLNSFIGNKVAQMENSELCYHPLALADSRTDRLLFRRTILSFCSGHASKKIR